MEIEPHQDETVTTPNKPPDLRLATLGNVLRDASESLGHLRAQPMLSRCWKGAKLATVLALGLIALSEYEARALERQRSDGAQSIFRALDGLASSSGVSRVTALSQLPDIFGTPIPVEAPPSILEGVLYLIRAHHHPTNHPYHATLQHAVAALVSTPQSLVGEAAPIEANAIIGMLCELGPDGWYNAKRRHPDATTGNKCLQWIWESADSNRITNVTAYYLFRGAQLDGARFEGKQLQKAEFSRLRLTHGSFEGANLRSAHFGSASIRYASFQSACMTGADFRNANLQDVSFVNADLSEADFTGAVLRKVDFTNANGLQTVLGLSSANQYRARLGIGARSTRGCRS